MDKPAPVIPTVHPGEDLAPDFATKVMEINLGPSHPAMHGTIKLNMTVDGETIVSIDPDIGYLHRGFEKESERATWTQVIPYTDRLNYVSPLINNFGYVLAVEKLLGIKATRRCDYIRTIMSELSRLSDHLTCVGAGAMELGSFTGFLYLVEAREMIWELIEEVTGARLTISYARVGGVTADLPEHFKERCEKVLDKAFHLLDDFQAMVKKNRIFIDRMDGIGVVPKEDAIAWGFTGPCGRASGIPYDVRRAHPYFAYDEIDFDVPIGEKGDNYDRYLVRVEELHQSRKILQQAFKQIPDGPVNVQDPRIMLPPKERVYGSIEGLIGHFKIVIDGIKVPRGEVYSYVEGGNGELGFYLVSNGSGHPWKCRVRPPCFAIMQGLKLMLEKYQIADMVPTFGSVNMIGGECDR
ncbi:MAG: NADH-quinone oxidoreductase subunit D [Deltaproteobacteria bacterium]|nr:NADH-quinone oxidoreductase subunit D [Deltaproteobacteria bacterium]